MAAWRRRLWLCLERGMALPQASPVGVGEDGLAPIQMQGREHNLAVTGSKRHGGLRLWW